MTGNMSPYRYGTLYNISGFLNIPVTAVMSLLILTPEVLVMTIDALRRFETG